MSGYYPDDSPAFDIPNYDPEPWEVEFPVVADIEYIGGLRVARALIWQAGATRLAWACEHGETAHTPEEAAANCAQYCEERPWTDLL